MKETSRNRMILIHIFILTLVFFPFALLINIFNDPGEIFYPIRKWTQILWYLLFFVYILCFTVTRRQVVNNFNYKSLLSLKVWALIIFTLLFNLAICRFIIAIDPFTDFSTKYYAANGEQLMDVVIGLMPLQTVLCISIIGPIFEEIYFREFLIGQLGKSIPVWLCILVSSIIFGFIFHGSYPLWGAIFGLTLGLLYVITKFWSAPLIVHILWNNLGLFTDII